MRILIFIILMTSMSYAHEPPDGVYPTTEGEWYGCCHGDDCRAAAIQVLDYGNPERVRVVADGNSFTVERAKVRPANTAKSNLEYLCTYEGERPHSNGANVMCVFWRPGLF